MTASVLMFTVLSRNECYLLPMRLPPLPGSVGSGLGGAYRPGGSGLYALAAILQGCHMRALDLGLRLACPGATFLSLEI